MVTHVYEGDGWACISPAAGKLFVFGDQSTRRDQLAAIRDALDAHLDAEADAMMERNQGEIRA